MKANIISSVVRSYETNMTQANQETVPASHAPCTTPALHTDRNTAVRYLISPLARAALDNGVSFADVQAYCEAQGLGNETLVADWYEACNVPTLPYCTPALQAHVTEMITDTLLEGALLRSVLSIGTVAHARLWWRGVL